MTRYTNLGEKNREDTTNQYLKIFLTKYPTGVNDYKVQF